MAKQDLQRNPVNYSDESRLREAIRLKNTAITTDGPYSVTSASSGATYSTVNGGEADVLDQLDNLIGDSIINASDINDINKVHTATVDDRLLEFTVPSWNFDSNRPFRVEIESDVPAGTVIQVKMNDDTAYSLKDIDGADITSLDAGYYTFIAKTGTPNFFVQAPTSSGAAGWLQQYDGTNAVLKNEKENDITVKADQYVNNEFYETAIVPENGDNSVVSLLHFDGTDGSTEIQDETNTQWIANGNAQLDTAQKKFGTASVLFDGTGDWIDRDGSDIDFSNRDFTIDFWVRRGAIASATERILGQNDSSATVASSSIRVWFNSSNQMVINVNNGTSFLSLTTTTTFTGTSDFIHIAIERYQNTMRVYIGGVADSSTLSLTNVTIKKSSNKLAIGRIGENASDYFNGHIDEFRMVIGEAKYTSNFTPPTSPYVFSPSQIIPPITKVTDTLKSLIHFNGTDGSTTIADDAGLEWTANGNAQLDTAQKQFGTASILFDGTGDWIDADGSKLDFSDDDFTIDFWAKRNTSGVFERISGKSGPSTDAANISLTIDFLPANTFRCQVSDGTTVYTSTSTGTVADTNWHHYAVSRDENTLKLFIDGTPDGTADISGVSINYTTYKVSIGRDGEITSNNFNGHIDEFRMVIGEAKYKGTFTPPTSEYVFADETNPNHKALIDGTLEMNELTVDNMYNGWISNVNLWNAGMEGQNSIDRQFGSASLTSTLLDIDVSEVDLSKSIVRGWTTSDRAEMSNIWVSFRFLDADTIRLFRTGTSGSCQCYWEVIQFDNSRSVQSGTINISNTRTTQVSLSAINSKKSLVFATYLASSGSNFSQQASVAWELVDDNTLEIYTDSSTVAQVTVEWFVVEFN